MIARIHIDPAEWPRSEGIVVDVKRPGEAWRQAGLYALRARDIDIEVNPGDRIRAAGFREGAAPHGSPAGVMALLLSDFVEVTCG